MNESFYEDQRVYQLQPATPSAEQKDEHHDQQDEADASATVVAQSGPHIVAAAAKEQQENDQDEYCPHGGESNTRHRRSLFAPVTEYGTQVLIEFVPLLLAQAGHWVGSRRAVCRQAAGSDADQ